MKKILISLFLLCCTAVSADTLTISKVRCSGSFEVKAPVVFDSINSNQEKYSPEKLIDTPLLLTKATEKENCDLSSATFKKGTLNMVGFTVKAEKYVKDFSVNVLGAKKIKIYADGKEFNGSTAFVPGSHAIDIKFVADSANVSITVPTEGITIQSSGEKLFSMTENLGTRVITDSNLSPSGNWALMSYVWYDAEKKYQSRSFLLNLKTKEEREIAHGMEWMPTTDRYYKTENVSGKTVLKVTDPQTGKTEIIASGLPSEIFGISPTEDFAVMLIQEQSPKKETGVYEIIHPDDRQPAWRTRYSMARYDFRSGLLQPLTYTYRPVSISDITPDGKTVLFSVMSDTLQVQPTNLSSYYTMNLNTLEVDTLVENDGFVGQGLFAGKDKVVFSASTNAFNGIGKILPEGRTPNGFDYHLYVMELPSKKIIPVTAADKTSIESISYSPADGGVYYSAQNGDSVSLYRLDMKTYASKRITQPMEVLSGFSVASATGNILVYGSSACVPYRTYSISQPLRKSKMELLCDPNKEFFEGVKLGQAKAWQFRCSRGYDVTGFYFLPADFDVNKKYPVIVHYYGGCSPTSRRFGGGSHYPAHYWNAMGYIVLVVNPSGASGFGQEWASRHVNTMGEGPAQDIIDATRQFAKDVPQVDAEKIGCVSASYGGFMTQYMLTKDNPFACGISHAGISDHTSYWGEGYWGYSYSQVSAANSYPWTRKDLFVDRSPLYNADKIKKPLLFTHGTADTNVPPGESIQMYTALKLLGVPTGLILVEGENHHIMDPVKRVQWINSMVAWFDRWLKGDDSWWNAIYTPKTL